MKKIWGLGVILIWVYYVLMENSEEILDKSDQELVALTLENQSYFLHLVSRYKLKLFAYVRRISNFDSEEAEDVLQDVFLKVYMNLHGYDPDLKFSSWVYRIAHNQVISEFRKRSSRPQSFGVDLSDDRVLKIASEINIEAGVDKELLREKLKKLIAKLGEKSRDILILKFFEEKDYKEISDILKIPMGTVASRMSKAKQELREVFVE